MEAGELFRLNLNYIQFQIPNIFTCLIQAQQSLTTNYLDVLFLARGRERCILFKDHDQLPILYISSFLPPLKT
jgi:hypothetical protein